MVQKSTVHSGQRLTVSRDHTAELLDCSPDHIDDLANRGQLERIKIGKRKVAITMRSIERLIEHGVA